MSTPRRLRRIKYTPHDFERQDSPDRRKPDEERSEFERDRSRVIHSGAFRRLQGKTQVFTTGEGDFYRTRLTHSLEVAQIAKGLALRLGAHPELVETVALIHDIGHPPFGHAGEDELKKLMKNFGGFEANAQNIRILTNLESKSLGYPGLNLTRAVLDGQLKYKVPYPKNTEKFVYDESVSVVTWASDAARGEIPGLSPDTKSFECEIMDWADDIAYAIHDLEDAIHARYIGPSTFIIEGDRRTRDAIDEVQEKDEYERINVQTIAERLFEIIRQLNPSFQPFAGVANYNEQKAHRKQLTSGLIARYIKAATRTDRAVGSDKPVSYRYLHAVNVPTNYRVEVDIIKRLVWKFVIESPQVRTLEEKGRHIIRGLFRKYMQAENGEQLLPPDWRERLQSDYTKAQKARVVCDYISGMTDDYAQRAYAKLFLPNQGSIYEVL